MLRSTLSVTMLLLFAISGMGQPPPKEPTKILLVATADSSRAVSYTLDVLSVIDSKCLGCHNPNARNEKARNKLQWEQLQELSSMDALAKLDEMLEVLEEGKMPPEQMVERFPNMKLSDEETATLKAWVEATLAKLEEE